MKKAIKTISLLCVLIFTIMTLGGCGTEPGVSKTQTDFTVVDEQGKVLKFLTADNEEVKKVSDTVDQFLKKFDERDYKNFDSTAEYGFYTQARLKTLIDKKDAETTEKYYKDNQIQATYEGMSNLKIAFSKKQNTCIVTVTDRSKLINATDKFLSESKMKKGSVYGQDYNIVLSKEVDVWKVNDITGSSDTEIK